MNRRWFAAAVLAVVVGIAAILGYRGWRARDAVEQAPVAAALDVPPSDAQTIETVAGAEDALPTGGTPMAQRVAVVGLLNKRNGVSRDLTLKPGQAARVGDVIVRMRACEQTAPWEQQTLTGSFVQVDVRGVDRHWRRVFSGWLYKERPALNVVQHPIYDVWTKSCTMSWPATGPDTQSLSAPTAVKEGRSSAKKSPAASEDAPADTPTTPASAPSSNAT